MKKFFETIWSFLDKLFPLILILLSLYIYRDIMDENKEMRQKIEALTGLISYKSEQILKNSEDKKSGK
jgi:hypothetical protein